MQLNRPLMDVNEDSEILFKLGILSSNAKSKKKPSAIHKKVAKNGSYAEFDSSITDDEDSDLDVLYDKRSLLKNDTSQKGISKNPRFSLWMVLPVLSFLIMGLLSTVVYVTLPEIGAATKSTNSASLLFVVLLNGLGCVVGNISLARLYNRTNLLLFLIFCAFCSIPATLFIAWSTKILFVYIYSFILGVSLGFLYQGTLMIAYENGCGVRLLLMFHACLAIGSMLSPLVCSTFVEPSLSNHPSLSNYSLPTTDGNIFKKMEKHRLVRSAVLVSPVIPPTDSSNAVPKPIRPDHATGIEQILESKSNDNQGKAKTNVASHTTRKTQLLVGTTMTPSHKSTNEALQLQSSQGILLKPFTKRLLGNSSHEKSVQVSQKSVNAEAEKVRKETAADKVMGSAVWISIVEQIAGLTGIKLAYGVVALLAFLCVVPFFLSSLCCCEKVVWPSLRATKPNPEKLINNTSDERKAKISLWVAMLLFLCLSGAEITFSVLIAVYAFEIFGDLDSQIKAFYVTSAFWAGTALSRLLICNSSKVAGSVRVMQFLLLVTAVISSFMTVLPHSSPVTLGTELFVFGFFLSPIAPCILNWLETQKTVNWLSLCFTFSVGISIGRTVTPYLAFLFISKSGTFNCCFVFIAILLGIAFLMFLILIHTVRNVARVIAVEQFSRTLMSKEGSEDAKTSSSKLKKTKNGEYEKLINDEISDLEVIASDEECEDEL